MRNIYHTLIAFQCNECVAAADESWPPQFILFAGLDEIIENLVIKKNEHDFIFFKMNDIDFGFFVRHLIVVERRAW